MKTRWNHRLGRLYFAKKQELPIFVESFLRMWMRIWLLRRTVYRSGIYLYLLQHLFLIFIQKIQSYHRKEIFTEEFKTKQFESKKLEIIRIWKNNCIFFADSDPNPGYGANLLSDTCFLFPDTIFAQAYSILQDQQKTIKRYEGKWSQKVHEKSARY